VKIYKLSIWVSLFLVYIINFNQVFAQSSLTVRGNVSEMVNGKKSPMPGVTVAEFDVNNRLIKGSITDLNGNFVLKVSSQENKIQISFIGYETKTYKVSDIIENQSIILSQSTSEIEEVVVTARATGNTLTGVAERDMTSSSAKIDLSEMRDQSGASVESVLQGQVSGLDIIAASGNPGSGANIVIRGMGTLGNANPLIVVDGIAQNVSTEDFSFTTANQQDLGQLLSIAPQDILSVEVLKDAAATAVWGSKGANGVLIIETKKGSIGKMRLSYQYKLTANIEPPGIPMLNGDEYITMIQEEYQNRFGIFQLDRELQYDVNYSDFYNYSQNTDWVKAISRDAYTNDHYFELSGGDRKSLYFTSVNYQDQLGTTLNTSFKRFSVRANFDYKISDYLRLSTNFGYTNTFRENNPSTYLLEDEKDRQEEARRMTIRGLAYRKAPHMSIWEYDENGELTGDYFTPIESFQGPGFIYWNPVAIANLGQADEKKNIIENNFKLNYIATDWLKFIQTVAFSFEDKQYMEFIPSSAVGSDWLNGIVNKQNESDQTFLTMMSRTQAFLSPFKGNRDHYFLTRLLWEMEQTKKDWLGASSSRSPSVLITDPAAGAPIGWIGSGPTFTKLYGALMGVSYKYKDRYLVNLNIRADGNSAYSKQNRWGLFPSVSFGWRFSEEPFLSSWDFLNDSKLRVSWGRAGKKIDDKPYSRFSTYVTNERYIEELAIIPINLELTNLKWETVSSWNVGADISMFKNRIQLNADIYNKITTNLLWPDYVIPRSTGYINMTYFNGGTLQNYGWEYFMNVFVVKKKDFDVSLNFNISQNLNKFLKLPDNFKKDIGSSIGNGIFPRKVEEGRPIGSYYGFEYQGVYSTDEDAYALDENGDFLLDANGDNILMSYQGTYLFRAGDAKYRDVNYDGKIDLLDVVYLGNSNPNYIGGFGSSAKYKNFRIGLQFHYRTGFDIVNRVAMNTQGMLGTDNQSLAVLKRWRREGQDEPGMLPRAYYNHPSNNLGSSRYVEKGDFLRLNSVSFSYKLEDKIAKRLNVNSLTVGFTGRKLFTYTGYSGVDPEIGNTSADPFWLGQDNARTPIPKEYSVRIEIRF